MSGLSPRLSLYLTKLSNLSGRRVYPGDRLGFLRLRALALHLARQFLQFLPAQFNPQAGAFRHHHLRVLVPHALFDDILDIQLRAGGATGSAMGGNLQVR